MKFNRFPEDAEAVTGTEQGDTVQVREDDSFYEGQHGALGDWQNAPGTQKGRHKFCKLQLPIVFVHGSHEKTLVPAGAYLHYAEEGFFVWNAAFHTSTIETATT